MSTGGAGSGDGDADDWAVTLAAGDCQLAAAMLVAGVHARVGMAVGVQIDFGQRAVVSVQPGTWQPRAMPSSKSSR